MQIALIIVFALAIAIISLLLWRRTAQLHQERLRCQASEKTLQFIQEQLESRNAALQALQKQLQDETVARAVAEEKLNSQALLEGRIQKLTQDLAHSETLRAEIMGRMDAEKKATAEKLAIVEEAKQKLADAFAHLSANALQHNNQAFLDLAKASLGQFQETAKIDLDARHRSIAELLQPVKTALGGVDQKIEELEKARMGAYEVLKQQVSELVITQKELRSETAQLVQALRSPRTRGRWGEIQLRRVVEMAGMLAHCDFIEQVTTDSEEKRLRPDMIIRLPGGKQVVVDAKTPLMSYLEAMETHDETAKQEWLRDHARQVRAHISALGKRAYWEQFQPAPDFVIMFLPGEPFFSAALEFDASLIEAGVKDKVLLATPTTLIALLRAVAFGWRQESLAENAREIGELGQELYKRLADMAQHLTRLGRHLGTAVESYNQTVGTFERRVLVSARRFQELKTHPMPAIQDISGVDVMPRPVLAGSDGVVSDNSEPPILREGHQIS